LLAVRRCCKPHRRCCKPHRSRQKQTVLQATQEVLQATEQTVCVFTVSLHDSLPQSRPCLYCFTSRQPATERLCLYCFTSRQPATEQTVSLLFYLRQPATDQTVSFLYHFTTAWMNLVRGTKKTACQWSGVRGTCGSPSCAFLGRSQDLNSR
jgi:hypothetical protein